MLWPLSWIYMCYQRVSVAYKLYNRILVSFDQHIAYRIPMF